MLYQVVLIIHTLVALAIIGLVFLQHGKGADIGATFGGGASNTVFGSQGSGGVLYKATGTLALIFCITSISLTVVLAKQRKSELGINAVNVIKKEEQQKQIPVNTDVPSVPSVSGQ